MLVCHARAPKLTAHVQQAPTRPPVTPTSRPPPPTPSPSTSKFLHPRNYSARNNQKPKIPKNLTAGSDAHARFEPAAVWVLLDHACCCPSCCFLSFPRTQECNSNAGKAPSARQHRCERLSTLPACARTGMRCAFCLPRLVPPDEVLPRPASCAGLRTAITAQRTCCGPEHCYHRTAITCRKSAR